MFDLQSRFCLSLLSICGVSASAGFRAAVYEHVAFIQNDTATCVTAAGALELMNKNMDTLETAIKSAAKQNAQIIVTPELAIYGWGFTRQTIFPYLENIPDPDVNWIPCTDPNRFGPAPVQERLSCMAKTNNIYVVANVGDKKPCNLSKDSCPEDGQFFYNTLVAFDSRGKLVARYHKYHLFFEDYFNRPEKPQRVAFNTSFGNFGLFTCFDILFYDPAVALVNEQRVDSVALPTAWMNVLPHFSAIEIHPAWAKAMGVNLLSANINNKSLKWTGSGVFPVHGKAEYYYNSKDEEGHLVVAQVSHQPRGRPMHSTVNWSQYATNIPRFPAGENEFKAMVIYDNFTFTELTKAQGNYTVCHSELCCHLSYSMVDKRDDEVYALGAFDGMHTATNAFYLQICTLLKCKSTDLKTCGQPSEESSTKFESFSLCGSFGTKHVFPEVLYNGIEPGLEDFQVLQDGRLVSRSTVSNKPLLTATLLGRWYEKDPPKL
ncbi:pantetheine hydrolase VNN2-like [Lissotriton helveticus]